MKHIIAILIAVYLVGCASQNKAIIVDRLANTDSIVVLCLDSRKPAKVEIFRCTVEKTVHGPKPPELITLSFLHFPDCQRLSLGRCYLCAIRHGSGTGYTLIRSDMLVQGDDKDLYNCAWEVDSREANELEEKIQKHIK